MKHVLFIPVQLGLAHLLRSQAIAIELTKQGFRTTILIEEDKATLLPKTAGIKYITFSNEHLTSPTLLDDATKKQLTSAQVKKYVNTYRDTINDIKPDYVVVDTDIFGLIACIQNDTKFAFLVNALIVPLRRGIAGEELHKNPVIQSINSASGVITNSFIRRLISDILKKYDGSKLSKQKLLQSYPIIIPEWREYVHLTKYYPNFHFVGPIFNPLVESRDPAFERQIRDRAKDKRIIYVSFGGTGLSKEKLQEITAKLAELGYFVIVSTGSIAKPSEIALSDTEGFVAKFVPGLSATFLADCVVSHCSQGTVVHAIISETPIVGIPFNLDQLVHGYKIEELGVGINTHKISLVGVVKHMYDSEWLANSARNIPVERVIKAVEHAISSKKIAKNLEAAHKKFGDSTDGASQAADFIEKELVNPN